MTKLLFTFIILTFTLNANTKNWIHNYDFALKKAKIEKKDIYVFVGADVCRFCDTFKKDVLSDESLIKTMQKDYVLVYLSRDRHTIPSKFKTIGVPIHYFTTSNGEIYFQTWGGVNLDGWKLILDEADLSH